LYKYQASIISRPALLRALRAFNDAVNDYRGGWQPQLALELALVESLTVPQEMVVMPTAPVQQVAPPPAPASANPMPEVDSNPNAPAAIAPSVVRQNWAEVQRVVKQYNSFVPALMAHAQVQNVEGNVLIVGVPNDVFREKLSATDKREALEKALFSVLQVPLRVQVALTDAPAAQGQIDTDDPLIAK